MFSAPIPAPAAARTRADARRSLVKRIALALALFALVGWFCWRIYETTPVPTRQPAGAGLSPTLRATTKVAMDQDQNQNQNRLRDLGRIGTRELVLRKRPSEPPLGCPKIPTESSGAPRPPARVQSSARTAKLPAEMVTDIVVVQGRSAGVRPLLLTDSRAGARKDRFWRVPWRFAWLPQFQCKPYRMPRYMRQCNWNAFVGTRGEDRCKRCSSYIHLNFVQPAQAKRRGADSRTTLLGGGPHPLPLGQHYYCNPKK